MRLLITIVLFLIGSAVMAQSETPAVEEERFEIYQIYLDKPAKSVDEISYEKDGEKIDGEISDDGKRVYIKNYYKRGRLKFKLTYQDGTKDEFSKSSCFIDPVPPL